MVLDVAAALSGAVAFVLQHSVLAAVLLLPIVLRLVFGPPTDAVAEDAASKGYAASLHELRDAGARRFVRKLVSILRYQAKNGRSDYEFKFHQWDVWFEFRRVLLVFVVPVPVSYWDCVDSPGSREVVRKLLEGEAASGAMRLRADWSVSTTYGTHWLSAKWVLNCQWDKPELRTGVYGGR